MAADHGLVGRRHSSRRLALQALYQWQIAQQPIGDVLSQFREDIDYPKIDPEYFEELFRGVVTATDTLDGTLEPYMSRPMEQVDPIERAVLRLAVYELSNRPDIPYRVVLDEAIGLSRKFGAVDGFKFVNGVLDKAIPDLRKLEKAAEKGPGKRKSSARKSK
ncbi:MAG: transcription antitermination factor NusB [bacterium]